MASAIAVLATLPDAALHRRNEDGERRPDLHFALFAALRREQSALVRASAQDTAEPRRILALAQAAFRDLEALLAGRPDDVADTLRDGEWTLRDLLRHAIATELRYCEQVRYSAGRAESDPLPIPNTRLPCDRLNPPEPEFGDARRAGIARLMVFLATARERTDRQLAGIDEGALDRPSMWGSNTIDVRERMHQIAAHLVEVSLQTEKMLRPAFALDGEARAIARRIWSTRGRHERSSDSATLERLDAELERLATDARRHVTREGPERPDGGGQRPRPTAPSTRLKGSA